MVVGLVPGMSLTAQAAETTVTTVIFDKSSDGNTINKGGVTCSSSFDSHGNIPFGGTFSTSSGKFTKIVVNDQDTKRVGSGISGWSGNTWTGSATSVQFGNIMGNGQNVTITFTIDTSVAVTGISLNQPSLTLDVGGTYDGLVPEITPSNATDTSVTWSSDNTDVATVDADGVVTAVAPGTANITVITTDGGKTATCAVIVNKSDSEITTEPKANTLTYNGSSQALITAGTVTGGKLVYSTDNEAWSETIPTGKDAGSYTVYYKVKGDDKYNETEEQKIDVTIQPKSLTITADAKSKKAGDKDPALTYTSEGLVDGDSITGALTRKEGETAGTYAIAVGTLTAGDNYKIDFKGADLTIAAADIITYTNTEGNGSNWTLGSDGTLEFKFSRSVNDSETIKHFTGIKVDDTVVDSSNYTYKAGSVIVNLKSEYLAKLSEGKHTLTALFDDGDDVTVSFEILAKAKQDDNKQTTVDTPTTNNDTPKADTPKAETKKTDTTKKDTPKAPTTGDKINMGIIVMLMIDSTLAALYLTLKRKQIK
ncbi:MAG: Ig-like domain-containing protein [Lachnospiraceae bacterium]|nr:Ig-like domain-containing protein [Lachnospiraceae bacterium]